MTLIEIPDPEVIASVIIAFLIGLGGLFAYYKLRPMVKINDSGDASQQERLEYYERQLIDMKIRLDALELQGISEKTEDPNLELKQFLEKLASKEGKEVVEQVIQAPIEPEEPQTPTNIPSIEQNNPIDHVLHLITTRPMTSRDIQITLKRSREHTSRLMKKLFEEGYVQRNTESKPYTYSISEKGKEKIGVLETNPTTA